MEREQTFGELIRFYREKNGLTRSELADALVKAGINRGWGFVHAVEAERYVPKVWLGLGLGRVLGIPDSQVFRIMRADAVRRLIDKMQKQWEEAGGLSVSAQD